MRCNIKNAGVKRTADVGHCAEKSQPVGNGDIQAVGVLYNDMYKR